MFRSTILKASRTKEVTVNTKLSFLHPFWQIPAYYPIRNPVAFDLTMKDPRQILSVGKTDTKKYRLEITKIQLKLVYAEFEARIKERWNAALATSGLVRSIQCGKSAYFSMKQGARQQRFPSIFSFSVVPSTMLVWFLTEKACVGDFNTNRFCYTDPGLQGTIL